MRTAIASILACATCYAADTDNVVSIAATTATCSEGGTPGKVTVSLDRSLDAAGTNPAIEVEVTVSGTALPGLDYTALPTKVTFGSLVLDDVAIAGSTYIPVKTVTGTLTLAAGSKLRIGSGAIVYTVTTSVEVNATTATAVVLDTPLPGDVAALVKVGVITPVEIDITALADTLTEGATNEVVEVVLNDDSASNNFSFAGNPPTPAWINASVDIVDVPGGSGGSGSGSGGGTPKPTPASTGDSGGCGGGSVGGLILAGLFALGLRRRRRI